MISEKITYRLHAVKRMFERKISEKEVRYALETGEVSQLPRPEGWGLLGQRVEDYPDDTPYPSCLILSCYRGRLIHVVAANNSLEDEIVIITVYEPDPSEWGEECRKRIQ
jgi:hypothetical protein